MVNNQRSTLGDFMNVTCFQYLRLVSEEITGRAPIVAAGRKRGYDVIEELGLLGSAHDGDDVRAKLDSVLGAQGTRLCIVQSVIAKPNSGYEVRIVEGACTANQTAPEPVCAYTLGVFVGAIHALTGRRMNGAETECSACGAPACVYQIDPI
jgi:predicted hydrocarbon binding protein